METEAVDISQAFRSNHFAFSQWLAKQSLDRINPGPDGLESLRRAQCGIYISKDGVDDRLPKFDEIKGTAADSTLATAKSPLFRLPGKVRGVIFTYALTYTKPIPIRKHKASGAWYSSRGDRLFRKSWRFSPPLLHTCREVMKEAAPIFYANNTFTGTIYDSRASELTSWLHETDPSYVSQVKKLLIKIEPTSFADLVDIVTAGEGHGVSEEAFVLVVSIRCAGLAVERVKIGMPTLTHVGKDLLLTGFDGDAAEMFRFRWVEALELELSRAKVERDVGVVGPKKGQGQVRKDAVSSFESVDGQGLGEAFQLIKV